MQHASILTTHYIIYNCAAQVAAPTWATSTAPAPGPGAPAVGIQFIMTGVSVAQLNQTQLRCARVLRCTGPSWWHPGCACTTPAPLPCLP